MGLPKRKISKTRRDKRRTHWKLAPIQFHLCPQCKKPVRPHHACTFCGYYEGLGMKVAWVKHRRAQEEESA